MIERQRISRVCFDYAVVLNTDEGAEVRLECPFHVSGVDGVAAIEIDPAAPGDHLGVLVGFLHQQIVKTEIEESGELRLTFSGGQVLVCPPNDSFEAWGLVHADGEWFVCRPGGGFTHIPARAQK